MEGDRILAARYRLIGKLVEGGMGAVWRAEHLTLRTHVAIKLIDQAIADSPEALSRFEREAQAAAELRSTHIVQILDYGVDDGTPYIAMELLEGESLAALLARSGKLAPDRVARLFSQAARGLSRAHDKGVVHRDLKPDNIFIAREGEDEVVKVLDFGIAKKLDRLTTGLGIKTHTGSVLGSPFYMSPEQATGLPSIDHRSDIWSFAVVAYECLTGTRPFERDTLGAVFTAISQEPLPVPSQVAAVPRGFDEWFARAAARHPDARYQSVSEAAQRLREVCEQPIDALTSTAVIPTRRLSPTELSVTPSDTAPPSSLTLTGVLRKRTRSWKLLLVPVIALAFVMLYFTWRVKHPVPTAAAALPTTPNQTMRTTQGGEHRNSEPEIVPSSSVASIQHGEDRTRPEASSSARKPVANPPKRGNLAAAMPSGKPVQPMSAPPPVASSNSTHSQDDVFVGF